MRTLLLVAAGLAGCSTTAELMLGCGPRKANGHLEGACELRVQQRFGEHGYCAYTHGSEPQDGRGGDESEPDLSVEQGACGLVWGGR